MRSSSILAPATAAVLYVKTWWYLRTVRLQMGRSGLTAAYRVQNTPRGTTLRCHSRGGMWRNISKGFNWKKKLARFRPGSSTIQKLRVQNTKFDRNGWGRKTAAERINTGETQEKITTEERGSQQTDRTPSKKTESKPDAALLSQKRNSEVNSNAQNLTQPQRRSDLNWPQICEAPPATVFPAGIRNSSRSWTTSGLQVIQFNLLWIPLCLMCFTCVSLASPPCGCSVWHLIARSCVLTFLSDRHLRVMSLPAWRKTCLVPVWLRMLDVELFSLSSWQQTTRFNVSWRIRQHRNTLETETTVGGRQSGRKQQTRMFPWAVLWRLFQNIREATFGGRCCKHKVDVQDCK